MYTLRMGKHSLIDKVERLHEIHKILDAGRSVTKADLARILGVTEKTIQRDLQDLREKVGAEIIWDASARTLKYATPALALPPLVVHSEDEVFAVLVASQVLREFKNTHLGRYMEGIASHLMEHMSEKDREYILSPDKFSYVHAPVAHIDPEVWETVTAALRHNRLLDITYQKVDGSKPSKRKIAPLHLRGFQGRWYLLAYCYRRNQVLIFHVSRIREAKPHADGTFNPKRSIFRVDLATYFPSASQMFVSDDTYDCRIRFSPTVAERVKEVTWVEGQTVEDEADGSVVLSFSVPSLVEVCHFVLQWGGEAEALEPEALVEMIRADLDRLCEVYRL